MCVLVVWRWISALGVAERCFLQLETFSGLLAGRRYAKA
jgi:hypothetical protein